MDRIRWWLVDEVARWWTQAPKDAQFRLLQRVCQDKAPEVTVEELHCGIILAETEANEVDESTRALGERIARGEGLHGEAPPDAQVTECPTK
jgi:hypothetical protein